MACPVSLTDLVKGRRAAAGTNSHHDHLNEGSFLLAELSRKSDCPLTQVDIGVAGENVNEIIWSNRAP